MYKTAFALTLLLICHLVGTSALPGISYGTASSDFVDAFLQRGSFIEQRKQQIDSANVLPKNAVNEYNLACIWRNIQIDSAVSHMRAAYELAVHSNDHSLLVKAGAAL